MAVEVAGRHLSDDTDDQLRTGFGSWRTLLAYDKRFELGPTLAEASKPVHLAHPYCATFCVLGGAACGAARKG